MTAGPIAILVGMPGAGKTTAGRRVARRLGVQFRDADEVVEQDAGRSVRAIFATDGEAAFREMEAHTIAGLLAGFDGVLAVGGGALLRSDTRERLAETARAGTVVVQLSADLAVLRARVGDGSSRPLLTGDAGARLAALAAERSALFDSVATCTVRTDTSTRGRVADHIVAAVAAAAAAARPVP